MIKIRARQAVILAAAAALLASARVSWAGPSAKVGEAAPHLQITTLNGQEFNLAASRSKVTIVNFWATWCPPCRREMPVLGKLYDQYHGRGLAIIGISTDRPRDRGAVVKAAQEASFPIGLLQEAKVNDFGAPTALPLTYVIDQEGVIRGIFGIGGDELEGQVVEALLKALLTKP